MPPKVWPGYQDSLLFYLKLKSQPPARSLLQWEESTCAQTVTISKPLNGGRGKDWGFRYVIPSTKQELVAVNMAEAVSNITWSKMMVPLMIAPTTTANMDTMKDATVACTCTSAMLPSTIWKISRRPDMLPRFACVERRDARHMSRLPFSPSNDGTRMNSSDIWTNTFQFFVWWSHVKAKMKEVIRWNQIGLSIISTNKKRRLVCSYTLIINS